MGIKIRMRFHVDENENWMDLMEDGDIKRRIKIRIKIRIGINKMQITFNARGCVKYEPIFKNCFF